MKTLTLGQFNAMTPQERAAFTLELQRRKQIKRKRKDFVRVVQGNIEEMRKKMKDAP